MKVLIAGSSGLIGRTLCDRFIERGDEIVCLVRRGARAHMRLREVQWDPVRGSVVNAEPLEGADAVFNLCGVSIAKRWTPRYKRKIRNSRIKATQSLVKVLGNLRQPPATLITSTGVAIYGNRGEEQLTEHSKEIQRGFLARLGRDWEHAANEAQSLGCRVAHARLGGVLSPYGGMLHTMARPFRMFVGGPLGSGRQWTPWIDIEDCVAALMFIAENAELNGPVIVCSPQPARNIDLSRAIGKALKRPAFLPAPPLLARLALGRYVKDLGLASALAQPQKLLEAGFVFRHPEVQAAVKQNFTHWS